MNKSGIVLILTDAIFTFFLIHLSNRTGIIVVSELSLTSALPPCCELYILLSICLLTLVFGVMSDSWSKFGPLGAILIGILSCFLSGVFLFFDPGFSYLALILFVYFSSSPIRNVFLLEQHNLQLFDEVERFVFSLTYMRLWVRTISVLFVEKWAEQFVHVFLTATSLVYFILYYLTFTTFLKVFFYEPTYICINFKILKCFAEACVSRRKIPFYRREEIVKGNLEVSFQNQYRLKDGQKFRKCVYQFLRMIFPGVNVYVTKETNYLVKIEHWLVRSRPASSEYVILQTLQFYNILPTVVLSSFFSHISNMILLFTNTQSDMVKKTSMDVLDHVDVYAYFLLFQVVFFPIVEVCRPSVSKILKNDIYIFFLGYGLLLVSCTFMIIMQMVVIPTLPYTPSPLSSQVRLFNANNQTIYVATTHEKVEHFIKPYDYRVFSNIPQNFKGQGWVKCNDKRLGVSFHLEQKETISYVIKNCVLTKRNSTDPNLFKLTNNSFNAIFYLVSAEDLNGKLVLSNIATPTQVILNISKDFDSFFLDPGTYNAIFHDDKTKKTLVIPTSQFVEGALYSLFIYKEDQGMKGKMIEVEGSLKYRFAYLLPQVALLALGHAFSTVSFFKFLYLQSPEKLRSTVFCVVLMSELAIHAISNTFLPFYLFRYPYMVTVLAGFHLAIFIVGVAFASNLSTIYSPSKST